MTNTIATRLPLVLALAAFLTASPLLAQGKGNDKQKTSSGQVKKQEQKRPQLIRRGPDGGQRSEAARREEERRRDQAQRARSDERWGDYDGYDTGRVSGNGAGKVPPGWCRGKGNPHNTPENCGYTSSRGTYGDGDYGRTRSGNGSYEDEHAAYHRWLDRKYSDLASRRPLDPTWQIRIRAEKKAEHDRWHAQIGQRHD